MKSRIANFFAVTALFATVALAAPAAQAIIHVDGTFVPSHCGLETKKESSVASVCVGKVVGQEGRAVQFTLNDDTTRVFQVVDQANMMLALLSGKTKSNFFLVDANGNKATMKVILNHDGTATAVQGELDGRNYFVPEMEIVFVMM